MVRNRGMWCSSQGCSLPRAWLFLLLVLHTFHFQSQLTVSCAVFPEKELISKEQLLTSRLNRFLAFQRVQQYAVRQLNFLLSHCFFFPHDLGFLFMWYSCGWALIWSIIFLLRCEKTAVWVMNVSSSLERIDISHMLLTCEMNTDCKEET